MDEILVSLIQNEFVLLGLFVGVVFLGYVGIGHALGHGETVKQTELQQTGIPGEATIVNWTRTSLAYDGKDFFSLLLEMKVPLHAPYDARVLVRPHAWGVSRVERGAQFAVRVDPKDFDRIAITGTL